MPPFVWNGWTEPLSAVPTPLVATALHRTTSALVGAGGIEMVAQGALTVRSTSHR